MCKNKFALTNPEFDLATYILITNPKPSDIYNLLPSATYKPTLIPLVGVVANS